MSSLADGCIQTQFASNQVLALLNVERERTAQVEQRAYELQRRVDHLIDLTAAYEMLGRDLGFTERDARTRWKEAGYGMR